MATSKLCPFQIITPGPPVSGINCIQEQCQLWVANTPDDADKFSTIVGSNNRDGVVVDGTPSQEDGGRCGAQTSDLVESTFRLTHHLHRHHKHPKAHALCTEIPSNCGDSFFGDSIPKSIKLAMEFESNEDQDGNTKIFGRDFTILEDEDTPLVLKNLVDPTRRPPEGKVKWADIKDDKFPPYVRSIKPSTISKAGGMWVRIQGSFFAGDLSAFRIKLGDPDNGIPYVNITNFIRSDSNVVFFQMPSDFSYLTEDKTINIYMKSWGNTFEFPRTSLVINSGGEATYKNRLKIKMEADDQELKDQMEALMVAAQVPTITTVTPTTVSKAGGIWVQLIGTNFPMDETDLSITIGDAENDIPSVEIEAPVVISSTKCYFTMPDFFDTILTEDHTMNVSVSIKSTGKTTSYNNMLTVKTAADSESQINTMLNMYNADT